MENGGEEKVCMGMKVFGSRQNKYQTELNASIIVKYAAFIRYSIDALQQLAEKKERRDTLYSLALGQACDAGIVSCSVALAALSPPSTAKDVRLASIHINTRMHTCML